MDVEKICMGCMKELKQPGVCPHCGYNPADAKAEGHYLKPYTILNGKYLVGKVLGEGGFGITYIGYDLNLEMPVAIKEFYPNGFVTRESGVTNMISMYRGTNLEAVQKWKNNFIKEARTLAKCSHLSGIVGVKDFFEENATAYIVMEYLEGMTLKNYAKSHGGKLEAVQLLKALEPVMSSLAQVHEYGLIHRDISPDNIMLLPGGQMKLLDFGAARDYASEEEKSLSVMLKPGYAPEEQYRSKGKQGPWSDVYAFAATIYKCITGVTPPESMERMRQDELKKPSELGIQISPQIEQAIIKGMAVYAENRYQSMNELMMALSMRNQSVQQFRAQQTVTQSQTGTSMPVNTTAGATTKQGKDGAQSGIDKLVDAGKQNWKIIAAAVCVLLVIVVIVSAGKGGRRDNENAANTAADISSANPAEDLAVEDTEEEEEETVSTQDEEMQQKAQESIAYGKERMEEGDYDTALQYFSEALSYGAVDDEEVYNLMSDTYLQKGDAVNAMQVLNMGIEQTGSIILDTRRAYIVDHTNVRRLEQYSNSVLVLLEEYDEYGNIVTQEYHDKSGNLTEWGEYAYWSGLLSYEEHYYGSGMLKSSTAYDEYGREMEYYYYNEQGALQEHSVCQYSGSLLSRRLYYDNQGKMQWWKEYEIDQNGYVSRDISHNTDGSVSSWQDYEHDESGNLIYTAGFHGNGSKNASVSYEFDEYGNMIQMDNYDGSDNFEWGERYGYEYDMFGNPIKKYQYSGDSSDVIDEWDYSYLYEFVN